ncbi:MAG: ribonuclease III [Bacteroidetes bacterium]|nr:ribonuclease III [Bacteroidota bacterium]MDA0906779.1 ribonuclease III [Bacteroidota bacterium]
MGLWSRLFKKAPTSKTTHHLSTDRVATITSESKSQWRALEKRLGVSLQPESLFEKVLRHRSTKESSNVESYDTYERYEFLGDAVLDLVVADLLFERYPKENEGFLTKFRSKLVKKETLATLAESIQLIEAIQFGERTQDASVRESRSVLADLFESLIGGLYLTYGYDRVKAIITSLLDEEIHFDEVSTKIDNYKSMLLEYCQAKKWEQPVYEILKEQGPGHKKTFTVSVTVNHNLLGEGKGSRLKQAEQHAAKVALQHLNQSV